MSRLFFLFIREQRLFGYYSNIVCNELARCYNGKTIKQDNVVCHKNTATWKVVELTASDAGIPTEGMVQNQPWPTHPKIDAFGTTDSTW